MKVRKNNIIYNLEHYAKVYPNPDRCALCLANVQGDYDTIDFEDEDKMNFAFSLITRYFINNSDTTLPEMICLDNLSWGDSVNENVDKDISVQNILNAYNDMIHEHRRSDEEEYQEQEDGLADRIRNLLNENEEAWRDAFVRVQEDDQEEHNEEGPWNDDHPFVIHEFEGEQVAPDAINMDHDENMDPDEFDVAEEHDDGPLEFNEGALHLAADDNLNDRIQFNPDFQQAMEVAIQDNFNDHNHIHNQLVEYNNDIRRLQAQNSALEDHINYLSQQLNMLLNRPDNLLDVQAARFDEVRIPEVGEAHRGDILRQMLADRNE